MIERLDPLSLLRRSALPAACIGMMIYFAYFAVSGPTGILALREYRAQRAVVSAQVAQGVETKAALARQVELLDPQNVDPDFADELVRKNLGVVREDEFVLPVD
ncbi:septum formation initiator family protein [Polymorphobacter arshaanensis]|uniref:Septum formation initiator family protein n=1 Tax=Glacieibacterium arshaanense TaxID=2511025 RepID=A0A4Y9ESC3_9SPHN|nr:septum formation initiator family protein [Polymorphobacter arshaanensis]TFU06561.1 septum formation initiator family protein [Polymorphobacter arshaanensis]